jgi:hypothetical protein
MIKIVCGLVLGIAVVAGGCSKDGDSASNAAPEKAGAAAKGLKAKGNDAKVVAAAKKVLKCEWKKFYFKQNCEDYKTWKKGELLKAGKADVTLVNMMEDGDEKVRLIAGQALRSFGKAYRSDKKMSGRVLKAFEANKVVMLCNSLGGAAGGIDVEKTGMQAQIEKNIKGHALPECREALTGATLFRNKGLYDFFIALAKESKDAKIRKAAISAFWTGTPSDKHETSCKLWLEKMDDADVKVASESAHLCAFRGGGRCAAQYDALLSKIEARAKAGTVQGSQMAGALKYLHKQDKATPAQKAKALAIAKLIVPNEKNDAAARGRALEFLGEADPAGKTMAAKYKDDKEFHVKNSAKRVLKGK